MTLPMTCVGDVAFGSYLLNLEPFHLDDIDTYNAPEMVWATLPRLVRPGVGVSGLQISPKLVTLQGRIVAARRSRDTMVKHTDLMKRALENVVADLKVGYTDNRVYLNARLNGTLTLAWPSGVEPVITWSAPFLCPDPLPALPQVSLVDNTQLGTVAGNHRRKIMLPAPGGNAFTYPVITITVPNVVGAYGTTSIWVINSTVTPNEQITVNATFAANDVLVIDCSTMAVTLNGVAHDYFGRFLRLDRQAGATNSLEIHSTSTSLPTLNITVTWRPRFY